MLKQSAAGRRGRLPRLVLWTAAAIAVLAALVVFGLPLLLRGPLLARLVDGQAARLCGAVSIEGGHLGMGMVPALVRQRPFEVALDGLRVLDPRGAVVVHARTARLQVAVLRRPWRLVVDDARLVDGGWKLVSAAPGEPPGVIAAFRTPPDPGGREACMAPTAKRPAKPAARPPTKGTPFAVRGVTLDDISVELSFPAWGLALSAVDARGTLEVRTMSDGTRLLFDAREAQTDRGGHLRIGPAGKRMTPDVPFDWVRIGRVAVTEDAPSHLLLVVQGAHTGVAKLSGEALFTNVFKKPPNEDPVGTEMDARWTNFGTALARTPGWQAVGEKLALLGVDLKTDLLGPFSALTGTAALTGKSMRARIQLLPERSYAADVRFDRLRTTGLLPAARRQLLGGRLDGHLALKASLAPSPLDMTATLDALNLTLVRERRGRERDGWPRRWVLQQRQGGAPAASEDDLRLSLGRVGLRRGRLQVAPLRLEAPGMRVQADARAQVLNPKNGEQRAPGRVAATVAAALDLDRLMPGGPVTGPVRLQLALDGTPQSMTLKGQSRSLPIVFRGDRFLLPRTFSARLIGGRQLTVAPLEFVHLGGGTFRAHGWLRLGDEPRMSVVVTTHGYRLSRMPGLAWALSPPRRSEIRAAVQRATGRRDDRGRPGEGAVAFRRRRTVRRTLRSATAGRRQHLFPATPGRHPVRGAHRGQRRRARNVHPAPAPRWHGAGHPQRGAVRPVAAIGGGRVEAARLRNGRRGDRRRRATADDV